MANSHPGSYCGQDAYNDMFVTENKHELFVSENRRIQGIGTKPHDGSQRLQRCNGSHIEGGCNENMETVVRRLTPTECERLQGFPDGWTLIGDSEWVDVKDYDIKYDEEGNVIEKTLVGTHKEKEYFYTDSNGKKKKCSDSARYKALGNSIALPFWFYLLRRISAQYERPATLGSLFDGIGGFPLCWERCNGRGTARWASEIEEFPIAVTQYWFEEGNEKWY